MNNRISILLKFIVCLVFCVKANSQVVLQNSSFSKLKNGEYLDFEYGKYVKDGCEYQLKIFKASSDGFLREELFLFNDQYGNIQISEDGKLILLSGMEDMQTHSYNYYLIDGKKGKMSFVFNSTRPVITTRNLEYYIIDCCYESEKGMKFEIRKTRSGELKDTFFWKVGSKIGGGCLYYRSSDSDYDFRICYIVERNTYGDCYYNIKKRKLNEVFNDTFTSREYENEVEHTPFENGWTRK